MGPLFVIRGQLGPPLQRENCFSEWARADFESEGRGFESLRAH